MSLQEKKDLGRKCHREVGLERGPEDGDWEAQVGSVLGGENCLRQTDAERISVWLVG